MTHRATCPTMRLHLAVKAQAAATSSRLLDSGFVTMGPDREATSRVREAVGGRKPVIGGLKVCWDTGREKPTDTRTGYGAKHLPGELAQTPPTPGRQPWRQNPAGLPAKTAAPRRHGHVGAGSGQALPGFGGSPRPTLERGCPRRALRRSTVSRRVGHGGRSRDRSPIPALTA